jgi:hypothetical protein
MPVVAVVYLFSSSVLNFLFDFARIIKAARARPLSVSSQISVSVWFPPPDGSRAVAQRCPAACNLCVTTIAPLHTLQNVRTGSDSRVGHRHAALARGGELREEWRRRHVPPLATVHAFVGIGFKTTELIDGN